MAEFLRRKSSAPARAAPSSDSTMANSEPRTIPSSKAIRKRPSAMRVRGRPNSRMVARI